ncbi:hypothetical protein PVNG_05006 [Plasmodium vivax North Korean]|uniref:Uncharacterized protein n=1 Tax=Plasmodium vivax North Korean TaxID=1035514 RepID=A0A0J9U0K6_PLAVI|nr:hypothetical protein PVNG_05006 [Plasmodium vivax North Korean]
MNYKTNNNSNIRYTYKSIINRHKNKVLLKHINSDFESSCKLSEFIKSLDSNPETKQVYIDSYLSSVIDDQKDAVRSTYSELMSLYSSIEKQEENIKLYCCSYLNYWLDKQRKRNERGINEVAWEVIYKLWNTLKNSSVSCKRQHDYNPLVDMERCFEFMVYCVNRNELRKHCEQDDELKNEYCRNFNEYTKNYYNQFSKKVTCLRDTNKDIHYNWQFSDTCTLHNVARTFPKYDTNSETIVDDTSRKPINKCEDSGESKTINCYMLDGVPVTLEELPTIDMILLKHGIYAGTSILGFFSLGLYLYKVNKLHYLMSIF